MVPSDDYTRDDQLKTLNLQEVLAINRRDDTVDFVRGFLKTMGRRDAIHLGNDPNYKVTKAAILPGEPEAIFFARRLRKHIESRDTAGKNNSYERNPSSKYTPEEMAVSEAVVARMIIGLMVMDGVIDGEAILQDKYKGELDRMSRSVREYAGKLLVEDPQKFSVDRSSDFGDPQVLQDLNVDMSMGLRQLNDPSKTRVWTFPEDDKFYLTVEKVARGMSFRYFMDE